MMKLTHSLGVLALVAGSALTAGCALQAGEECTSTETSSALGTEATPTNPGERTGGPINPIDKISTGDEGNPQGPTPWPWRSYEEGAAERPPIPDPSNPLLGVAQQKTK